VETPAYVISETRLRENLGVLRRVKEQTGCRILLALKGFAMPSVFPLIRGTLDGVCASSPHEARLGSEEFGGEIHAFAPAYTDRDIDELAGLCHHLVFNSLAQWERFRSRLPGSIACGLRINPECSTGSTPLYDPCAPGSRLGIRRADLGERLPEGISGLHFHTLCEQNADALERTLEAVEERFGDWLDGLPWLNLGGGHHITRDDYKLDQLCELIRGVQERHGIGRIYLEPGEAVALGAGVLVAQVLDTIHNGIDIALLDTSAAAHMPDVLEMPYRPRIVGAGFPGEKPFTTRLGGSTCLAGDVIGDYALDRSLQSGDRLIFEDMAHYTMVKNTTFNGVRLPSIYLYREEDDRLECVRSFGYEEYRRRLG
jgi:carboxynorspermidine decarboxylase